MMSHSHVRQGLNISALKCLDGGLTGGPAITRPHPEPPSTNLANMSWLFVTVGEVGGLEGIAVREVDKHLNLPSVERP